MNASFLLAFYGRAVAEGEELRKTRHGVKELMNFLKYQVSHWTHWVERKPMVGKKNPRLGDQAGLFVLFVGKG